MQQYNKIKNIEPAVSVIMTPKEELIQAIERSPDEIVQEFLAVLKGLQTQQVTTEIAT